MMGRAGTFSSLAHCLTLLLFVTACTALRKSKPISSSYDPVANPAAIVIYGNARFTVLTSWVIRMEWARNATFEDRASFAIVNRRLPVPKFSVQNNTGLTITTEKLTLIYKPSGNDSFSPYNLAIKINGEDGISTSWTPGMNNTGNLLGTIRTLDLVNGSINLDCNTQPNTELHCSYGVISTLGWSIVDESARPLFDNDPVWAWWANRTYTPVYDWYFFGHGLNFEQALADYTAIGGNIPLPPRFTFGTWWSRYWAYSDIELMDLVEQFEMHQVPLDVFVIDMDWHYTFYKELIAGKHDQAGMPVGWTGYTFDPDLFPDPEAFLAWLGSFGLKATLNLHPASGVQPFEERYPEMAIASGIDPATNIYVPFDAPNKTYARNIWNEVLRPLEEMGIDFWWLDWQQGEEWFEIPGMNPTFWLNYCFFTNPQQWANNKRPMLFHRWGGMGNHRYQIGFSGDVIPSWASLTFQPYFTATAANVAYGFWSHDIGGHTLPSPPELFTRWVQWGAFSPVLRTHSTKQADNDRRIWTYPLENFFIMRDAFLLRASMVPYIYTAARIAHDTGLAMVRALYYTWPTYDEAYQFPSQYTFGDDIVVSPITQPVDSITGLIAWKVWIPPGEWIEWFSGQVFGGPQIIVRQFALDDIPVYVRSGSIIPMESFQDRASLLGATQLLPTTLTFQVFPTPHAHSGETNLYEDDGDTNSYTSDSTSYVWTTVNFTMSSDNRQIDVYVSPVQTRILPAQRNFRIIINNVYNPANVFVNGILSSNWSYIGPQLALEVVTDAVAPSAGVHVQAVFVKPLDLSLLTGMPLAINRISQVKTLLDDQWENVFQEDYKQVIYAASTGQRMSFNASRVPEEISEFGTLYAAAISQVQNLTGLSPAVQKQAVAMLILNVPG